MKLSGELFALRGRAPKELFDQAVNSAHARLAASSPRLRVSLRTIDSLVSETPAGDVLEAVVHSELAVFDITASDPQVLHLLGIRQALTSRPTICVYAGDAAPSVPLAVAKPIELNSDAGALADALYSSAISGDYEAPLRSGGTFTSQFKLKTPIAGGKPRCWRILDNENQPIETRLVLRPGDIRSVRDLDAWVNSENIFMEMAPVHNPTISGIIRHLGANWRAHHNQSDDALRRDLAEEMGARRAVDIGTVLFSRVSKSTELFKTYNVSTVAHVATVEPVNPSKPGSGFTATDGLRECMWNVLEAFDARNRRLAIGSNRVRKILVPMLGSGTGGADIGSVSQILVNTTIDYLRAHRGCSLREIHFLARTEIDVAANLRAIELNDGVVEETL